MTTRDKATGRFMKAEPAPTGGATVTWTQRQALQAGGLADLSGPFPSDYAPQISATQAAAMNDQTRLGTQMGGGPGLQAQMSVSQFRPGQLAPMPVQADVVTPQMMAERLSVAGQVAGGPAPTMWQAHPPIAPSQVIGYAVSKGDPADPAPKADTRLPSWLAGLIVLACLAAGLGLGVWAGWQR